MKKLRAKIRKAKITRWSKLTFGEKILKVVMKLIKIAVIVAVALLVAGVVVSVVLGAAIAFGIARAIGGGFDYIHYNEPYVRLRK